MSTICNSDDSDCESLAKSFQSYPESESESEPTKKDIQDQLSPRLLEALSPSGFLYDILWPMIIDCATHEQRNKCLCYVNRFFARRVKHCVSEIAKRRYRALEEDEFAYPRPVHLDLEALANVQWASWDAEILMFESIKNFREFCALGDVDPDTGASQYNGQLRLPILPPNWPPKLVWIFISRTRDLVFETSTHNPNLEAWHPYAHYFGITGRADKVKRMYEYVVENEDIRWSGIRWGIRGVI